VIYLDHNATTPIDKSVAAAMQPFINDHFGNPSSSHQYGITARKAVDKSRQQVATFLNAKPTEIIFTSGGSESNNMIIKGVAHSFAKKGKHIITSQIEHPAVINPCKFLERNGYSITYLPVDRYGAVLPSDVAKAITSETILVTIMHSNNETGTIQPIREISTICREKAVLLHTDAAQSVGKVPVNVQDLGVDFLSIAGHKIYAPKGIGALYIRDGIAIEPLIHGAGHENGRRAGTENVIFDVALGRACEVAAEWVSSNSISELTERLLNGLKQLFGSRIRLNGHPDNRLPNTLYISFLGYTQDQVLGNLQNVAISTGSACHSGTTTISSVLRAMGVGEDEKSATIRFSLGRNTTENEIDIVLNSITNLR